MALKYLRPTWIEAEDKELNASELAWTTFQMLPWPLPRQPFLQRSTTIRNIYNWARKRNRPFVRLGNRIEKARRAVIEGEDFIT